MSTAEHLGALNDLLSLVYRSLPMYLAEAAPWTHLGDERAGETLANIVRDQRSEASRLADLILSRSACVDLGGFPMGYTDRHFLSMDFLLKDLVREQQTLIRQIEGCVSRLSGDAAGRALAEEVLGAERAHLDALEELVKQPA